MEPQTPVIDAHTHIFCWGENPAQGYLSEKTRKVLMKKEKPWHEGPLYVGMRRMEGPSDANPSKQTRQYMTFRTISSRPTMKVKGGHKVVRGWIHPGIRARRFAPRVQKHLEFVANEVVRGATRP